MRATAAPKVGYRYRFVHVAIDAGPDGPLGQGLGPVPGEQHDGGRRQAPERFDEVEAVLVFEERRYTDVSKEISGEE
jgi:hypothetical protein